MYCGASCFNRVIELNQKMLILSKFLTKKDFLCNPENWIVYEILCNIKLCSVWRFDEKCLLFTEKLFVFKYWVIFIVLELDTSTYCSMKLIILIRFVAIYSSLCQSQVEFLPSLGVRRPLTSHILISPLKHLRSFIKIVHFVPIH